MKKIIRWFADISGVSNEVRRETIKEIGGRLYADHYWWNGGIMYPRNPKTDVMNAFYFYGTEMRQGGIPDIQQVRDRVYKLDGKYFGELIENH